MKTNAQGNKAKGNISMQSKGTINYFKAKWPYFLIASTISVFSYYLSYTPQMDWLYFNSLAHFSWPFEGLNIQHADLNSCGGVDNFANPQMWYFSPTNILYLIFNPYWANIVSWYLFSMIGYFFLEKLAKENGVDELKSKLVSVLFIMSSFFSLHFIEGHIVFRTFFLIPAIYYLSYKNLSARKIAILGIVLTIMILDGGIYPFFYSLILLFFSFNYKEFKKEIFFNRLTVMIGFACLLVVLSKLIPVLSIHASRIMQNDPESYTLMSLLNAFYNPLSSNFESLSGLKYRVHEYALYLGLGLSLLILLNLKTLIRLKEFYFSMFFLWIATGFGGAINPWTIIKSIPYLQQIHVQSRFLIIFYFFILIGLFKVLRINKKTNLMFLSLAVLESILVTFYVTISGFNLKESKDAYVFLNSKTDINFYEEYITKPAVYGMNKLSHGCYEPAQQKWILPAKNLFFNTTSGLDPLMTVERDKVKVSLKSELTQPLIINLNWNAGWECEGCELEFNDGIIQVNKTNGDEFYLTYSPFYSPLIYLCWILGWIVGIYGWRKYKKL